MIFISGNCEDEIGKALSVFWEYNVGEKLNASYSAIGIISEAGRLDGVVLFTEYTGSNIEVHFKGFRCLNKTTIKYIANYVFNYLKCNILRVKLHSKHQKYIEDYLIRLGFRYEFILEKYYGGDDDAIIYKMDRNKAIKWVNLKNGST